MFITPFKAYIFIDILEDKTVVTINGIKFKETTVITPDIVLNTTTENNRPIEDYLLENQTRQIKGSKQANKNLRCINETYSNIFSFLE